MMRDDFAIQLTCTSCDGCGWICTYTRCLPALVGAFESGDVIDCAAQLSVLRAVVAFGWGVVMMSLADVRSVFETFGAMYLPVRCVV